jgi:GntP family gluconate:H+ symporter
MDSTVQTLLILAAGVTVVIGGILWLRLHAFLALILAALTVAALTTDRMLLSYRANQLALPIAPAEEYESFRDAATNESATPPEGAVLAEFPANSPIVSGEPLQIATREVVSPGATDHTTTPPVWTGAAGGVLLGIREDGTRTRLLVIEELAGERERDDIPSDAWVISQRDLRSLPSLVEENIGSRVADAFGNTAAAIGILIAMASIVGKCLLDSGAADRIVRTSLRFVGERFAPAAFIVSGFALGIPVFFDTVFYLMIPLGKALGTRTGQNYLLYVLTIVAGATMAHSLVPPTPGPLFVAEALGVDLGAMILAGTVVGLFCSAYGYLHATIVNRMAHLPLRESPDLSLDELHAIANRPDSDLPPFFLSLLPIVLPVVLIGGYTILEDHLSGPAKEIAATLGDKDIALTISAAVALGMLAWQRRTSRDELAAAVGQALTSGGVIILITSAGGAFGAMLQQTGVAGLIENLPQASPPVILSLAFLITTAVRTAQGSATVAMITAVGILGGVVPTLGIDPVYLALAIGCGSKPLSWMNDSGFWVITKMSGMTEAEGLRFITPLTAIMGLVGLAVTIVGSILFPHPF